MIVLTYAVDVSRILEIIGTTNSSKAGSVDVR